MYNSLIVAENLRNLVKSKNITLKILFEECNMGRNSMSHMTSGSMPKGDTLAIMADYLNVSVDYLLGRTDDPTPLKNNALLNALNIADLSPDEIDQLKKYIDFIRLQRNQGNN